MILVRCPKMVGKTARECFFVLLYHGAAIVDENQRGKTNDACSEVLLYRVLGVKLSFGTGARAYTRTLENSNYLVHHDEGSPSIVNFVFLFRSSPLVLRRSTRDIFCTSIDSHSGGEGS